MKLAEALEIAEVCGLETKYEAVNNIITHAMNLFVYQEINNEIAELVNEAKTTGIKFSSVCGHAIPDDADGNHICYMCERFKEVVPDESK